MAKMIMVCLLIMGVLGFAATAFQAEAPLGVPPLQCNPGGSIASAANPVPNATTNCGSYTCSNNGTCCDNNTCCPSGYNLYCRNKNMCYTSISDAKAACGDSYFVCWVPAR